MPSFCVMTFWRLEVIDKHIKYEKNYFNSSRSICFKYDLGTS